MSEDNKYLDYSKRATNGVAVAASFANARAKEQKSKGRMFTAVLFAFIVIFLLLLLLVGTQTYRSINDARVSSDETRLALSLLVNSVRLNDTTNAVGIGVGPEGDALVLTETLESGAFETRIYKYQGRIVQEYSAAANPYTPEWAREIVESDVFEFTYDNGLLTITTERGSVGVALRSLGGGAS